MKNKYIYIVQKISDFLTKEIRSSLLSEFEILLSLKKTICGLQGLDGALYEGVDFSPDE